MTTIRSRPEPALIRAQWRQFISNPSISFHQLKKTALSGNLTILRSLYWRIFLGQLPTPSNHLKVPSSNVWSSLLESSRREWDRLKIIYLRAPDGLWLEECSEHSSALDYLPSNYQHPTLAPITPNHSPLQDLGVNNPLSQHEANPWKVWLDDLELRKIIQQDVVRTFPDLHYFRQPRTQVMLTNILHVYCKIHQEIGYRQGMHELLGVLLETLDLDSLEHPIDQEPELVHQVLAREFLEHDAFNLFSLLMRPMKDWYDSNSVVPLLELANHQTTPLTSLGFIPSQLDALHHPTQPDPCSHDSFVHPIVDKCTTIFHVYLKQIDPSLWAHLAKLEIEPQLWGIRWLRLLFTREFSYHESLLIWDGILAEDGVGLRLADFMCIAMLLRIRQSLLEADYSNALQLILRFPKPDDGDSRIDLLLYQALLLSRLPTPTTASLINRQNLDQKLFSHPSSSPAESDSSWFGSRRQTLSSSPIANPWSPLTSRYSMHMSLNQGKPIDDKLQSPMIAMGPKKSQSLGKSKSLLSAFADLRKSYSPTAAPENHGVASSPPNPKEPVSSKPLKQDSIKTSQSLPQTDCLANQQVGQALGLCVDALEQNILNFPQIANSGHGLALGVLKHIRDVMLSGFSSGFDSNVMSPLIDYQSDTHQNNPLQDHHPASSSQSFDSSSPQSFRNTLALDQSSTLSESPPLLRDSSFSGEGPESVELSTTRVESNSLRSPLKLSSASTSPSSVESIDSITQHLSSSSPGSSSTGAQSSKSRTILARRKSEGFDGLRLQSTIDRERDDDHHDLKRPPARAVQKLSPSIFGTKLWMESRSFCAPQSNWSLKKQRDHRKSKSHNYSNLNHEDDDHPPLPLHLYHSPTNPSDPSSQDGSSTPAQHQFESLMLVERRPIFL